MKLSCPADEFLGHSDRCTQGAEGLLDADWDEALDIPVRAHLLSRWLREDHPQAPALLTEPRPAPEDAGLTPEELLASGLFQVSDAEGELGRRPLDCRPVEVAEAAAAVERALLAGPGTPTRRVALLAAELSRAIVAQGQQAVLVTAADPDTGEVAPDETHVVLACDLWSVPLIRLSVAPRTAAPDHPQLPDPACEFAACPDPVRLSAEEHARAESRLRAVCAGTVLAALLGCDGRAAFEVGRQPHRIPPGRHQDLDAVRGWWQGSSWYERYGEDHIDVQYDYGAGDWIGRHTHLAPSQEELAALDDDPDDFDYPGKHCLRLGDPADPPTGLWILGDELRPLATETLLAEVEAFRKACQVQAAEGELAALLVDDLLTRPLRSVGGPAHRIAAWADADDSGAFWRTDEDTIDEYEDARRLLAVGPEEALYIVFRGELGA